MASMVMTAPDSARLHQYSSASTMVTNTPDSADRRSSTTSTPVPDSRPSSSSVPTHDQSSRSSHPSNAASRHPPSATPQSSAQPPQRDAQHGQQPPPTAMSSTPDSPASSRATQSTNVSSTSSPPQQRIKIKDLQHIQSFCADANSPMSYLQTPSGARPAESEDRAPQYEISNMPVTDVIEMVAGLLTKITTTNDSQAEQLHRNIPTGPEAAAGMSAQTSSVLAFHGKNVPTISIMAYLSRIHKYCPATYEVFLSLLVYFDRITEKVNSAPAQAARRAEEELARREASASDDRESRQSAATDDDSADKLERPGSSGLPSPPLDFDPLSLAHFFVVDSYNIHRLVIAGVTCASKFFSDVFYTNSRYAKVGGLPLVELNHLELQFLILNDFRLSIPVEELEAYATMLVEFYAREVLAQQREERMEGVEAPT